MSRLRKILGAWVLAMVGAASSAYALPMATTFGGCHATSNASDGARTGGPSPKPSFAPKSQDFHCSSALASSEFQASVGLRAAAGAKGSGGAPGGLSASSTAGANALVSYWAVIGTVNAPPRSVDDLPVIASAFAGARADTTFDGGATAQAFVDVRDELGAKLLFHIFAGVTRLPFDNSPRDSVNIDKSLPLDDFLAPGRLVLVQVNAGCDGISGTTGTFSCTAAADPTFAFDQARFDVMSAALGVPSFRLADYFTFEFSPNVLAPPEPAPNPVPLPPAVVLFATGLAVLLGRVYHAAWRHASGTVSVVRAAPESTGPKLLL
jgi:hypothetical protein